MIGAQHVASKYAQIYVLKRINLTTLRPMRRLTPPSGPYRAPERHMEHVRDPDRADGKLVRRGNPNDVALEGREHICCVVDLNDCVTGRVDKGEVG
jgi:hypothetical protein